MEKISKHLSYNEVTFSNTAAAHAITNAPNEEQLSNIKLLAKKVFEPTREHVGVALGVTSVFRSKELNAVIPGSSNTSQHCADNGAAMDINAFKYGKTTNEEVFNYIKDNLEFDQLIAEGMEVGHIRWVHVSYKEENNRNQILIMYKDENGKSKYLTYTEEEYSKFKK